MKKNALVGFSGFVGQNLLSQRQFDDLYRSVNITDIIGKTYDTVVCAGAPAVKWLANKDPVADRENIGTLMSCLKHVKAQTFILISTVDVFKSPIGVNESTPIETDQLHPYGYHRYELEQFIRDFFPSSLVVRLPGLVGKGLKKNLLFDLKHDRPIHLMDSRSCFQFYPVRMLWQDIQCAMAQSLSTLHLAAEPVTVAEVASVCFGIIYSKESDCGPVHYDFQTKYSSYFGKKGPYQYDKLESLAAIREYAQEVSDLEKMYSV